MVSACKQISRIERAFRCLNGVDLLVRPINWQLADRVGAHVFPCMLAYCVAWHMLEKLAPLLLQDDGRYGVEKRTRTRRTADGFPVHSFAGLLRHLATPCKNIVVAKLPVEAPFTQHSQPTELQKRAFELPDVETRL